MSEGKKIKFDIHESHIVLWENQDWTVAFLMGGRANGRSGTASRFAISKLLGKEYLRGAIMRAVHSDIRTSCWGELMNRVDENDLRDQFKITENEMYIQYGANSLRAHGFRASSGSLTARLKSLAEYNFIWIEEGEEIGEDEFRTLLDSLRTKKGRIMVIITLNTPPKNHWIIRNYFDLIPHYRANGFYVPSIKPEIKNALYIPGTYRENDVNLDEQTIERYKKYEKTDPAYYWQMIEGLVPEVAIGRIYSNWRVIDEIPYEARLLGYGLDFGFAEDPDALVAVYYHDGGYILDEKYYSPDTPYETLATIIKSLTKAPLVADNNEPRMIAALRSAGVSLMETDKGKGSVEAGIKHVQGLPISYTRRSVNLHNEYENYTWLVSKDGENAQVEDPKKPNHLMSAVRYFLTKMVRPKNYDRAIQMPPKPKTNKGL